MFINTLMAVFLLEICASRRCFTEGPERLERPVDQCRQLSEKIKVLLDFFQKIVGFQRATPLVAFRRKRKPYALGAFLLLFAIEKEAEFEAEPHKLPQQFA